MEFTYRISEQEYLEAAKLYRKSATDSRLKKFLFFAFLIICLVLLFAVVMKRTQNHQTEVSIPTSSVTIGLIARQTGPLLVIGFLWLFLLLVWPRMRLRSIYRKSPALQSDVSVQATSEGFWVQLSTGSESKTPWSDVKSWHEGKGLVLLIHPTKIFQIVNLRGLSEDQRKEFRGILTSALARKK